MRRAAVAVMVGCAFGGIGSGVGHQHEISDVRLTAAIRSVTKKTAAMTAKAAAPAMKTVEYGGYAIKVPATWPVYLLSKDPGQCVRYDVNAVYLGTPGPNQNCPSHLIGRADTVSIGGPVTPGEPSTPVRTDLRAAVGAKRAGTDMPAEPGTILESAQLREFAVAMPGSAPSITATYGTDPDLILQVLAGLHRIEPQPGAANSAKQPSGHRPAVGCPGRPRPPRPRRWLLLRRAAHRRPGSRRPGSRRPGRGDPGQHADPDRHADPAAAARASTPTPPAPARPAAGAPGSAYPDPGDAGAAAPAPPPRRLPPRRPRRAAPWLALTPAPPRRCRP